MIKRKTALTIVMILWAAFFGFAETADDTAESSCALVIHGGAGTILKENMTPEIEAAYREKLKESLQAGYNMLHNGGSSLDAVQVAINILEDSPLFNAGKGAVFTNTGTNELDASIMDGATLNAGAVSGVTVIKNPIDAARLVLDKSPHVMLVGKGAETFAENNGAEVVSPDYFYTERRWKQLQSRKAEIKSMINSSSDHKFGTVGCAALDKNGNLAAGTSTGGMTNKRFGRVGDSPIIGAGTYANNRTCAVSATGAGEYFIRLQVTHDISALMEYKGLSLQEAATHVIKQKLTDLGGTGGVVAIDKDGNITMPFNTAGMYRGYVDVNGDMVIEIYGD